MHGGYLKTILRQGLNTRIVKVPPDNTLLPEVKIFYSALPIPQSDENYQDLQNNNVIKEEGDGVLEHVINKQIIAPKINLSDEVIEISNQEKLPDALISFQTRNESAAKSNIEDIVRQDSEIVSESDDKKNGIKNTSRNVHINSNFKDREGDRDSSIERKEKTSDKINVFKTEVSENDVESNKNAQKFRSEKNTTNPLYNRITRGEYKQSKNIVAEESENKSVRNLEETKSFQAGIKSVNIGIPLTRNKLTRQTKFNRQGNERDVSSPLEQLLNPESYHSENDKKIVVQNLENKNSEPVKDRINPQNSLHQKESFHELNIRRPVSLNELKDNLKEKQKEIDSLKIKLKQLESKIDSNFSVKEKAKEKYLPGPPVSTNLGGWSIKERSYFR